MKKYKEYMDGVKAPDTLHQRLVELEPPGRRPIPWKRYGAMAAALALVCGVGAWGLGKSGGWGALAENFRPDANAEPSIPDVDAPETADIGQPDIALVEPGDVTEPGEKTLGGYDVTYGSGSEAMVTHYVLPYIEYGEGDGTEAAGQIAADWGIPAGATKRDLTREEIIALMGGEDAVNTHLDWGEYELTGWAAWYEDGSFWGAYIDGLLPTYGTWVPMNSFELAVTAGQLPPTCFGYPYSVTQEVRGLTVTADKRCYSLAISAPPEANIPDMTNLTVRFMKDDYGYCFEMRSIDSELAEEMVSRLVCRIADEGLALTYTCPYCGHTFPFGAVHNDPAISAEGGYTCPDCGQVVPAGDKHYHTQPYTGESAIPGFVPDYDPTYEDGVPANDPEICGYPLYDPNETADPSYNSPRSMGEDWCGTPNAGLEETHACPICGEILPKDVEHAHELCGLPLAPSETMDD